MHTGEFEAVGFSDFSSVTGAVSTFGFVFYIQPIMMPLLSEMPASQRGVKILSWSTRIVVLGQLPAACWTNFCCPVCSFTMKFCQDVLCHSAPPGELLLCIVFRRFTGDTEIPTAMTLAPPKPPLPE